MGTLEPTDSLRCCNVCGTTKPLDAYHWQLVLINGRRKRTRDRTCKTCRHEQKRMRERARRVSDNAIERFLRLPAPRPLHESDASTVHELAGA